MITRQQMYSRMLGKDQLLYRISEKLTAVPDGAEGCGKVTALYVMAPVMCMYVAWVLREACAAGIRRLYFLARTDTPCMRQQESSAKKGSCP